MARKKREVKLITLDTETIGLDGDIKRIAIYDGVSVHYGYEFSDIEPILNLYYDMGYAVHIYIHNLEFDARKIPRFFERGNINWNNTILIDNKYTVIWNKKWVVHDSLKLLPEALSKLSKDFGLEHGKLDLWEEVQKVYPGEYTDHVDFLSRCDRDNELYLKYLGYDVISLYELIEKLSDISGIPIEDLIKRLSTASMSKYLFKNGYKGKVFASPENDKTDYEILTSMKAWASTKEIKDNFSKYPVTFIEIENKIRSAYFGGRTEVFTPWAKRQDGKIVAYHYDVNSLYPSVMINKDFPIGHPKFYDNHKIIKYNFEYWMDKHFGLGFIKAQIHIPQQKIPPLPVKKGKLVFMTGYIEGTWTYNELEYAIKNCGVTVVKYLEQIHFEKTYKVFHNVVETFYNLKLEGKQTKNDALTALAKLILNTIYGWTVLRRDDKTELKDITEKEKYNDRFNYEDEELGFINIQSIVLSDSIQPQIGAYVTSYARLVLLDMLRRQSEKGEVYYCDTDSIVCECPLDDEFCDAVDLGKWDLEGKLYEGLFLQPKVYYENKTKKETIKFKGVRKETQKTFDYDFYKGLYDDLSNGCTDKKLVEKEKPLLRSILYAQKANKNPNTLEYRDKEMNLGRKQKRDIDYKNNVSQSWYIDSLETFNVFSFEEPIKPYKDFGNLFNPKL